MILGLTPCEVKEFMAPGRATREYSSNGGSYRIFPFKVELIYARNVETNKEDNT